MECDIPFPKVVGVAHGISLADDLTTITASLHNQGLQATATRLTNRDGSESKAIKIELKNLTKLPTRIKLGVLMLPLEPFSPPPVHCKNCCRLGHTARACRARTAVCVRCGSRGHDRAACPPAAPPKCVNCGGPHSAAYKKCPKIALYKEANKIRNQIYIPYPEAIRRAQININKKAVAKEQLKVKDPSPNLDSSDISSQ